MVLIGSAFGAPGHCCPDGDGDDDIFNLVEIAPHSTPTSPQLHSARLRTGLEGFLQTTKLANSAFYRRASHAGPD